MAVTGGNELGVEMLLKHPDTKVARGHLMKLAKKPRIVELMKAHARGAAEKKVLPAVKKVERARKALEKAERELQVAKEDVRKFRATGREGSVELGSED